METKRNGRSAAAPVGTRGPLRPLQRFLCGNCGASFTFGRSTATPGASYSDGFIRDAVRLYVQGLPSYRVLAALLADPACRSVARTTLNGWVHELGARAKTPLQVSAELAPPAWGGVLGVDGKAINIAGRHQSLVVAVDQASQDIVHALIAPEETAAVFEQLIRETVTIAGYPLKGLVSDGVPAWMTAHEDYFELLPLQLCRIHASRRLDWDVPKAKRSPDAATRAELKTRIRDVLFAADPEQARQQLDALITDRDRYRGLGRADPIRALERSFERYMTHHYIDGMPADANITENVIKQLGKKLRLMEGFGSTESAETFIRLLIGCYRLKRFTDSCRVNDNGRSPLELAGIDPAPNDWLTYLLTDPE